MIAQTSAPCGIDTRLYNLILSKPAVFIGECKKAGIYSLSEVESVRIIKKEIPDAYAILRNLAHAMGFPE